MTGNPKATPAAPILDKTDWWRGAVIYQIYPRSFQDSNGDGIGDLRGIADRLPYVASLGVDAIWISPFFKSPMADFGYDVSDYTEVDPIFGTVADFEHLVDVAHRLGLKVLIDLVISHTSDKHPWFVESRKDRENNKANWYVWADAKPDGTPPNNWLSVFGGSAWQWDGARMQYYMHNFLTEQPDLNFHEPEVQDAVLDAAKVWLERGVDGFRLDTLNFYVHDVLLRDNPVCPMELRTSTTAPAVNPYNWQLHVYDKNQPENLEFVERFRRLLDEYGAASVGEIGDGQIGLDLIGEYTRGDHRINMCYTFDFLASELPTSERVAEVMGLVDEKVSEGWACWAFSNHDCERHHSRWGLTPEGDRLMAMLMMSLRGSACIYQGEELGFGEAELRYEDLQDPYGKRFWPEFKGRDGCRTPMAWDESGGFTSGTPWLPVAEPHKALSVAVQDPDPTSLLNFYRTLIAFRKAHPALVNGDHDTVVAEGPIVKFTRSDGDAQIFCAFNIGDVAAQVALPEGAWAPIGTELGAATLSTTDSATLGPWQAIFAQKVS